MTSIETGTFTALDTATLYAILRLRIDVFVVEQECAYPDLDGRDTEPGTLHVWARDASGEVAAYLRVLDDGPGAPRRIGRVCTAKQARGTGLGDLLMRAAVDAVGDAPSLLHAQTYAAGFYERFGYTVSGPEFMDDGIPHVPMTRG
ncbi:ElaA protein [Actinorhabdospora filicis]|uniref:ElaA protein n=1 Tax=Actinorhabdospora filicis TaxID=1785913 RepID=A0A9W6WBJ5_9ACTN|nr:GNAT family N-acetyltransferase [Actinorhabdospora filicis]GLZ80138.1 ElaA protein [Actinorhabdospora filicis]